MPRGHTSRKKRRTHRTRANATTLAADLATSHPATLEEAAAALAAAATLPPAEPGLIVTDDGEPIGVWAPSEAELEAVSPERLLLEHVRAELADGDPMDGECADCGHMADDHAGQMNDGACTIESCDCEGMVPMEPGELTVAPVPFSDDAIAAAAQAAALTLQPDDEGLRDAVGETIRLALTNLELVADATVALPDAHQPGETLPARSPSPSEPEAPTMPTVGGQLRWRAGLVPEGTLTDDGRAFAPDSIKWRELPLTLMAMINTSAEGGHDGALVAGRIDRIWRDETGMIQAEGVFDQGEYGMDIGRLVGDGTLRGVSVDIAISRFVREPRSNWFDDAGNWAPKPDEEAADIPLVDLLLGDTLDSEDPVVLVVLEGVIGMATVCPFQAFEDATIALAASLVASVQSESLVTVTQQAGWSVTHERAPIVTEVDGIVFTGDTLTAAAAGLVPVDPPAEWFGNPELAELTPLTVTDDGQVYGHAAAWDTCHLGFPDVCTTAPHSRTANSYFHLGEIVCDGGERFIVGKITMGTGHADRGLSASEAAAHYDNTGTVVADVYSGEDEHGIWVAGALRPNVDAERARELRAATLSGDWRNVNGHLELVALLAVNVPGFPIPRVRALVASGEDGSFVEALVAAGIHNGPVEDGKFVSATALAKIQALAEHDRFAELAARARDAA